MQRGKQPIREPLADVGQRVCQGGIATVGELRERFAVFHRENPRNTRIPDDLRAAVIAAMRRGVTTSRLRRACGLSTSQLARWLASARDPAPSTLSAQHARVFSVVGETPPHSPNPTAPLPAHELEMRLGPWSVSVRLATQPEARRG
jgi:hypothetical protein